MGNIGRYIQYGARKLRRAARFIPALLILGTLFAAAPNVEGAISDTVNVTVLIRPEIHLHDGTTLDQLYVPVQATDGTGDITIQYRIQTLNGANCDVVAGSFEYRVSGGAWQPINDADMTGPKNGLASAVDLSGPVHTLTWDNSKEYIDDAYNTDVQIRFRVNDGSWDSNLGTSPLGFDIDNLDPLGINNLQLFPRRSRIECDWTAVTSEQNWAATAHYEIWYGENQADVENRQGTASEWDPADDPALSTMMTMHTTITGLNPTTTYYMKIWAIDDFGNEASLATQSVATLGDGSVTITAGANNPGDRNVSFAGRDVPMIQLNLEVGAAEDVNITSITFNGQGTADEVAHILAGGVQLYNDVNGDGRVDAGDQLLGSSVYNADNGQVTFALAETIACDENPYPYATTKRDWLIVYDMAGDLASIDQTMQAIFQQATDITVSGVESGANIVPAGAFPISGGLMTLRRTGWVTVEVGENNPVDSDILNDATQVAMLQLKLTETSGFEYMDLQNITITAAGTGHDVDDLGVVAVYFDNNGDGVLDAGDTNICGEKYDADDGIMYDEMLLRTIAPGEVKYILVIYNFTGKASAGETFTCSLADSTHMEFRGRDSHAYVYADAPTCPIAGATKTIVAGEIDAQFGPANPGGTSIGSDFTAETMMMLRLTETSGLEMVRIKSITLRASGTGDESQDVTVAKLYYDDNSNGVLDVSDTHIGSKYFSADDETLTFALTNRSVPAGGIRDFLVVYDFNGNGSAGDTYQVHVDVDTDIDAQGTLSLLTIVPTGPFPFDGPVKTISNTPTGRLYLNIGAKNPGLGNIRNSSVDVPMMQFTLAGTTEDIDVSGVTFTHSGTGTTANIANVEVYRDENADGKLDGGDTPLGQSNVWAAGANTVTFAGPETITAGAPAVSYLVTYDFNGTAAVGSTFLCTIVQNNHVAAQGAVSGTSIIPFGTAPFEGGTRTVSDRGLLTISKGANSPPAANMLNDVQDKGMVQLALKADGVEDINVSSLTITHTGTGTPADDVSNVEIYLDADGDGILDTPGDSLIGQNNVWTGNTLSVAVAPAQQVPLDSTIYLLVVYDYNGSASESETFIASLAQNSHITATGDWSGLPVNLTGIPVTGSQMKIVPEQGHVTVALGANNPGDTNTMDGTTNTTFMQLDFTETSDYEYIRFLSLTVKAEGTLDDLNDLNALRLFFDENNNGVYNYGDTHLASASFTADDGTATFVISNRSIPKGGLKHVLIVGDIKESADRDDTFRLRIVDPTTDVGLRGYNTGIDIVPDGVFPIEGSTFTVVAGEISVELGENNPGPQSVCPSDIRVPVLQLKFTETTGLEYATINTMAIQGSGTGDDLWDVGSVDAYFDKDQDGQVTGVDVHLGRSTFDADNGTCTWNFTNRRVPPGSVEYVLIVYNLRGTASPNETFQATLAADSDMDIEGLTTHEPIIPAGSFPMAGGIVTMATDPSGIVFDSLTEDPIQNATVELWINDPAFGGWQPANPGPPLPGNHIAAADVNPQVTPADGSFAFNVNPAYTAAGYQFKFVVTPPAGYTFPSTVIPQGSMPQPKGQGVPTIIGAHGENFPVNGVETVHIPLDRDDTLVMRVTKQANKEKVVVGDIVTYTLTIENQLGDNIQSVLYLEDKLPPGFKYLSESTLIDGVPANDPTGTNVRRFKLGRFSNAQTMTVSYQLVVGSGVLPGQTYTNSAWIETSIGSRISNVASDSVKVTYDPIFDLSVIIGKVFNDIDGDGVQDKGEAPVADVKIATEDGLYVLTDKDGKYHIDGLKPQTKLLKVDPTTLPAGTVFTTENPRVVRLTNGLLAKVNFGVQLPAEDGSHIEKSGPEAPYLEIKLSTEPTMVDPELDIAHLPEVPQFDIKGEELENDIVFKIDTNYSEFIDSWKLEIYEYSNRVTPLKVFEGTRDDLLDNITWSGKNGEGMLVEPDETYIYVLTVSDREGYQDKTVEKTMVISSKRSVAQDVDADEIRDELFSNKIATQTIPVERNGVTVKIEGLTDKNARVKIEDENLGKTRTGKFNKTLIVPVDKKEIRIEVTSESSNARTTYTKALNLSQDYFFLVALGDAEVGKMSASGNIDPVRNNDKFRSGYYFDGRLAYYLKAKVMGKYLITSSFDSDRQKDELKRFIDPDKYYPVYGDSSSVVDDTNTRGRFYILVEWDKSQFIWGNYTTDIEDVELAKFTRTLYGAKLSYQSVSTTKYGDPNTIFVAFVAEADSLPAHTELISTGGSLYFLKHTDVVEGSETVRIEVRDKDTGLSLSSMDAEAGADYDIDYDQGRITFYKPVTMIAESQQLVSHDVLLGNPVYVVVDYEYEPQGFVEEGTYGGRLARQITDNLKLGVTYIKDERENGYELRGTDVTFKMGNSTEITAEYAESESVNSASFVSYDGGLTFEDLPSSEDSSGSAVKVDIKTDLGELFRKKENRLLAELYYQDIDPGFSSQAGISQQGKTTYGAQLIAKLTDRDTLTFMYDYQELKSLDNVAATNDVGAEKIRDYTLQYKRTGQKVTITGEYQYHDVQSSLTDADDETSHTVAGKVEYTLNEKAKVYAQQQVTVSGEQDYKTTVGAILEITKQLKVKLEQMVGKSGTATQIGIDTQVDSKTRMYTNYSIGDDDEEGKTTSTTVGSETLIDKDTKLITEQVYKGTDTTTSRSRIIGFEYQKSEWDFSARLERGEVTNQGVTTERTGISFAADYTEPDVLTFATKIEFRADRGETDKDQWLFMNSLEYKLNQDWTLFARMDYSRTENKNTGKTETESKEFVLGAALRPVEWDKFNMLMKLSYITDRNPVTQTDNADITEEQAWVFAIEGAYDITNRLQIVEKFAIKRGTERVGARPEAESQTYLWISRFNYHIAKKWDVGVEYRILNQKQAQDEKQGFLFEVTRHINNNVQLGVGYNFTDFDDDLTTDNDYTVKGPFFRMTGKY